MKKLMIAVVACAMFAACQQNGKKTGETTDVDSVAIEMVEPTTLSYEGVVPAADGPGIRYNLSLATDTSKAFSLKTTYLAAENGQDKVFEYEGTAEILMKKVADKEQAIYKLNLGKKEQPVYLLQVNDSTLRLVNDQLEESVNKELNYDLKLIK